MSTRISAGVRDHSTFFYYDPLLTVKLQNFPYACYNSAVANRQLDMLNLRQFGLLQGKISVYSAIKGYMVITEVLQWLHAGYRD